MRSFFFVCTLLLMLSNGCTLHFKASEIELESERQRVKANTTYHLASADVLKSCSSNR